MEDDCDDCCESKTCGALLSTLTWVILLFCSGTICFCLELDPYVVAVYLALVSLACVSHVLAMLSDPGFVAQGGGRRIWEEKSSELFRSTQVKLVEKNKELEFPLSEEEILARSKKVVAHLQRKVRYCKVCLEFKPKGAHHCRVCGRCVHRMDHHCPWVNTCVGRDNLRYFLQFLFYIMLSSLMSMALLGYRSWVVVNQRSHGRMKQQGNHLVAQLVCCVLSGVLCVIFFIFSIAMLNEQYEAITTDTPQIDALQNEESETKYGICQGLKKQVCFDKSPCSHVWWLPLPYKPQQVAPSSEERDHGKVD